MTTLTTPCIKSPYPIHFMSFGPALDSNPYIRIHEFIILIMTLFPFFLCSQFYSVSKQVGKTI